MEAHIYGNATTTSLAKEPLSTAGHLQAALTASTYNLEELLFVARRAATINWQSWRSSANVGNRANTVALEGQYVRRCCVIPQSICA